MTFTECAYKRVNCKLLISLSYIINQTSVGLDFNNGLTQFPQLRRGRDEIHVERRDVDASE